MSGRTVSVLFAVFTLFTMNPSQAQRFRLNALPTDSEQPACRRDAFPGASNATRIGSLHFTHRRSFDGCRSPDDDPFTRSQLSNEIEAESPAATSDAAVPPPVNRAPNEKAPTNTDEFLIYLSRLEVLEILRERNSCSAWFAQAEPDPAEKFATLDFQIDRKGDSVSYVEFSPMGTLFRQPYVARAPESSGAGSVVTLNLHGAFFEVRSAPRLHIAGSGALHEMPPRILRVGDYIGGSLKAQVTTMLHEYAHIVGLLPVDAGKAGSPRLSTQNTETLLSYCHKQIESSPVRSVVIPMAYAQVVARAHEK